VISLQPSCIELIVFMVSGTAADAVKPKIPLALEVTRVDWLRVSVFHDVRGASSIRTPLQDEYTAAAVIRSPIDEDQCRTSRRESHHDG
jgi:hypothetical protein